MRNTRKNWLLKWGIACYSLFVLSFFIWPVDLGEVVTSRNEIRLNFFQLFLLAIFLAPLLEEVAFRGYFTNKKWLKLLSIIFLLLLLVGMLFWGNLMAALLTIGYFALLFFKKRKESLFMENLLLGCSALIFAVFHWELSDFQYFFHVLPVVASHFGGGLVLLWITLNFSLLKSIFFHAGYNFLLMLFLFFSLQFPNENLKQMESENLKIEWKQVPLIGQEDGQQVSFNKDSLSATHAKLSTVFGLLGTLDKSKNFDHIEKLPLMHYDIKIYTKDSLKKNSLLEFNEELEKLLEKADLIYDES